jgi:hypothetical protein
MKQNIILWLGTFVILFLAGYLNNVTSKDYPVTGTIGINGQKVSYNFAKAYYTNQPYKVSIRSDAKPVEGILSWRLKGEKNWNKIKMTQAGDIIFGSLPAFRINSVVEYRIILLKNDQSYMLPPNQPVTIHFSGKAPAVIMVLFNLTLFGGLMLSIRSGLEYFKEGGHIRRYSLFTLMCFFLYFVVVPVKKTFDLDFLTTKAVPSINQLFDMQAVLLFLLWIAGMTLAFKSSKPKQNVLIIACLTVIIFVIL